jgi:hypothetical protein
MIDGGEEEDIIYEGSSPPTSIFHLPLTLRTEEDAESDIDEEQDEFVNALLEELSTMRTSVRPLPSPSLPPYTNQSPSLVIRSSNANCPI